MLFLAGLVPFQVLVYISRIRQLPVDPEGWYWKDFQDHRWFKHRTYECYLLELKVPTYVCVEIYIVIDFLIELVQAIFFGIFSSHRTTKRPK